MNIRAIIEVLEYAQKECEEHSECCDCPLSCNHGLLCAFGNACDSAPCSWNLEPLREKLEGEEGGADDEQ
jgi:hypothetical protein